MISRKILASLLFLSTSAFADDSLVLSEQQILTQALGALTIGEIQELIAIEGCESRDAATCKDGTCPDGNQVCTGRIDDGFGGTGNLKCLCLRKDQTKCGGTEHGSPQPPARKIDGPNSCNYGVCDNKDEECGVKQRTDQSGKPIEGRFECACIKKPAPTPPAGQQQGGQGGTGQKPGTQPPAGSQQGGQPGGQTGGQQAGGGQQGQGQQGGIIDEAAETVQTGAKAVKTGRTIWDIFRVLTGKR